MVCLETLVIVIMFQVLESGTSIEPYSPEVGTRKYIDGECMMGSIRHGQHQSNLRQSS